MRIIWRIGAVERTLPILSLGQFAIEKFGKLSWRGLPVFGQVVPPPGNALLLQRAEKSIERPDITVIDPTGANPPFEFVPDFRHHPVERLSLSLHEGLPLVL